MNYLSIIRAIAAASQPWPLDGRPRTDLSQFDWYEIYENRQRVNELVDNGFLEKHGMSMVFILSPAFEALAMVQEQNV